MGKKLIEGDGSEGFEREERAEPDVKIKSAKRPQSSTIQDPLQQADSKPENKEEFVGKEQRIEILKKFTKEALKKYGSLIRSIVLFGSTAREEWRGESDIDVFVIIDDTRQKVTPGMRNAIEDELVYIAGKIHKQLSLQQPYLLTEFWAMVREGHPIIFNFIREGIPVYDKDIFLPIKRLLQLGEIKPSKEAVEKYIERGPKRIRRVESEKMYLVVEDLYYAMLESAQAVLMFLGRNPPRPGDAPSALRSNVVKMKLMKEEEVKWLEEIIELRKDIEHKKVNDVSGQDLDKWIDKAKKFVDLMQNLIMKIEVLKRENMIEKSYMIMLETAATLLKALDKMPAKDSDISKAFEDHVIKKGLVDKKYLDVFLELEKMTKLVKEGKILDLQKGQILHQREYVRKFIRDAGRVLRKNLNISMDAGSDVGG
ncbi:MAG: nucleotidyltransferase domain-containing protein [Candidatus Aenigmarchaeota archaeon]|nr:nucleotidyltransferase domain-containing protein [Candidatus Aenigmarchaeota archaeon]